MATNADEKPTRPWQEIIQRAAVEKDPKRLAELSEELDRALAERDETIQSQVHRKKRASGI